MYSKFVHKLKTTVSEISGNDTIIVIIFNLFLPSFHSRPARSQLDTLFTIPRYVHD